MSEELQGYLITGRCTGCGACIAACPQPCISGGSVPYRLRQEQCIRCGSCRDACPFGAVIDLDDDD